VNLGAKRQVFLNNVQENTNTHDIANLVIEDVEFEGESSMVGEAKLAAVPASPAKSDSRSSKRCVGDTDEDPLKRASKLKAERNEGDNNPDPLSLNISDSCIQTNLSSVGIHLGQDSVSMNASLHNLKGAAFVRDGKILSDKKLLVLDH
jgi:hypothetical protein